MLADRIVAPPEAMHPRSEGAVLLVAPSFQINSLPLLQPSVSVAALVGAEAGRGHRAGKDHLSETETGAGVEELRRRLLEYTRAEEVKEGGEWGDPVWSGSGAGVVVMCAVHEYFKLEPETWQVWLELMVGHKHTQLVLATRSFSRIIRLHLRQLAVAAGVAPARLHFLPRFPDRHTYAQALRGCDLMLDTRCKDNPPTCPALVFRGLKPKPACSHPGPGPSMRRPPQPTSCGRPCPSSPCPESASWAAWAPHLLGLFPALCWWHATFATMRRSRLLSFGRLEEERVTETVCARACQ